MPASAADRSSTLHVPGQPDQQLQAPLLNITVNNVAGNIYYQGRTFNGSQLQDMGTCTPQQRSLVDTPLHVAVRHLAAVDLYVSGLGHPLLAISPTTRRSGQSLRQPSNSHGSDGEYPARIGRRNGESTVG